MQDINSYNLIIILCLIKHSSSYDNVFTISHEYNYITIT